MFHQLANQLKIHSCLQKKEREEEVLNSFIALYGSQAREQFVAYEEKDWSKEDYIGGCPAGLMQPGCLVYFEHTLRQRFGRYCECFYQLFLVDA